MKDLYKRIDVATNGLANVLVDSLAAMDRQTRPAETPAPAATPALAE